MERRSHDDGRKALERHLATLMNLSDDGVEDILDHLLDTDVSEDPASCLNYLSQLLGLENAACVPFVDNLIRYQKGESLSHVFTVISGDNEWSKDSKDGRSKKTKSKEDSVSALDLNNGKSEFVGESSESTQKQQKQINKSTPENKRVESNARKQQKSQAKLRQEGDARPCAKKKEEEVEKKNQQPTLANIGAGTGSLTSLTRMGGSDARDTKAPSRGKAKVTCGCFGTKHKPLTNCLFCGRIACEEEGYNYCGHCGYLIEKNEDSQREGWFH